MNRLGGRSNSGEGGEDPARYGTVKMSRSSRWRLAVLASPRTIWSTPKCCKSRWPKGAKPGEGGQLPGDKVSPLIAAALFQAGHQPDFAAAAPRHLLDRRSGPADF